MENPPPVGSRDWLCTLLREKCKISQPYDYQLDHGMDLIAGRDVFLVMAPGMGKTTLLHAPLLAAQARGEKGIGIVVVPTKLLGEQQAETACSRGLRALAINQDTVRKASRAKPKRDLFQELASGDDVRLGIMSPQMLQSDRLEKILSNPKTKRLIRWFLIDEVHLLLATGTQWITAYASVKYMRPCLSSSTIWGAITGTATPTDARIIAFDLGFRNHVNARYSIDRPNLKIIPRFLNHSVSGYDFLDLSFLIPPDLTSGAQIPTTMVFCETIELGWKVMTFLDRLISSSVPNRRFIVQLYNSVIPVDSRAQFMLDIQDGSILRIAVCTDTCTYGLDIAHVRRVVLFGLAPSVESLKQRMHRGGRDGAPATAYLFAPSWVHTVPLKDTKQSKDDETWRAALPPAMLQWYNATPELCPRHADLLQNEEEFIRHDQCCSLHDPEPQTSTDLTLVTEWKTRFEERAQAAAAAKCKIPHSDGTYRTLEKPMKDALRRMLEQWCGRTWLSIRDLVEDLPVEYFLPSYLLSSLIDKAHACSSFDIFRIVLAEWEFLDRYGKKLFRFITEALQGIQEIVMERDKPPDMTPKEEGTDTVIPSQPRVRLLVRKVPPGFEPGDIFHTLAHNSSDAYVTYMLPIDVFEHILHRQGATNAC
ncbi:P-loop containing nucleoside triphosphate hydrolase protein [Amylocystis lapponica]|nr:P-loop containing nucleoside triphosphate hydrolase protein [Amylocystis lapponica]